MSAPAIHINVPNTLAWPLTLLITTFSILIEKTSMTFIHMKNENILQVNLNSSEIKPE